MVKCKLIQRWRNDHFEVVHTTIVHFTYQNWKILKNNLWNTRWSGEQTQNEGKQLLTSRGNIFLSFNQTDISINYLKYSYLRIYKCYRRENNFTSKVKATGREWRHVRNLVRCKNKTNLILSFQTVRAFVSILQSTVYFYRNQENWLEPLYL